MPNGNPSCTKPGSHKDRVIEKYPHARCVYNGDAQTGSNRAYVVKISKKSHMILGQGISAEMAWKNAALENNC
jgi:hypothetical protein